MSQECDFQGMFSTVNFKKKSILKMAKRNYTFKASLKDYNIREQAAQDQINWCCLIRKGAAQYEATKICDAKRKEKKGKERAKGPPSRVVTCSTCKRQCRATFGLYSHQRTHTHT